MDHLTIDDICQLKIFHACDTMVCSDEHFSQDALDDFILVVNMDPLRFDRLSTAPILTTPLRFGYASQSPNAEQHGIWAR